MCSGSLGKSLSPAQTKKSKVIILEIDDQTKKIEEKKILEQIVKISEGESWQCSESIIQSIREPLLVLDSDLRIISSNRSFYNFFKVTPDKTAGKHIYDLGNKQWDIPKLRTLLEDISAKNNSFDNYEVEHEFLSIGRKVMLLSACGINQEEILSPKAKVILLAIKDITERREIENELKKAYKELEITKISEHESREYSESIINTIREPLVALNQDLRVVTVNRAFYEFFKVKPEDTMGQLIYDLGDKQWDIPKLRELLEDILPKKTTFNDFEVEHDFATIGRRIMLLNARQIQRGSEEEQIILLVIEDITEHKKFEEALKESKKTAERYLNIAAEIIISLDATGNIALLNDSGHKLLGYNPNELIGKNWFKTCLPNEVKTDISNVFKKLMHGDVENLLNYENPVKTKSGEIRIIHWYNTILKDSAGNITGLISSGENITKRREIENRLEKARRKLEIAKISEDEALEYAESIVNTIREPLITLDQDLRVVSASRSFYEFFKVTPKETVGQLIYDLGNKQWDIPKLRELLEDILPKKTTFNDFEIEHDFTTIGKHVMLLNARQIQRKSGKELILLLVTEDITARKMIENKIIYQNFHDHLTGLYNRRFFEEELIRLDAKRQLPLSIIMGDLNGLKLINDTFGHIEGDKLIKKAVELLKSVCRTEDILARWGGDEFVILLPKTSVVYSEDIVKRIKKECAKSIKQKIPLSLSIGMATKIETKQHIDKIIKNAENNMYKNKLVERESDASSIIFALEQTLFEKSNETMEHALRLKDYALKLGGVVKLASNQLDELSLLASLHDIGKVAIPDSILLKKGKLTEEEWVVIKRHPGIGFNIAQSSPQIIHIAKFIIACHENWDGSGYPLGLAGEVIPIASRIMFIVDAYDVMTSERSYHKPISKESAIKELKRCAGTQFDPVLVEKFIEIISNC